MSCKKCNEEQDEHETSAFYRWKNANIEMVGCDEHLRDIFDALNKAQAEPLPPGFFPPLPHPKLD